MKKTLLSLFSCAVALGAMAYPAISQPVYYQSDFVSEFNNQVHVPSDYIFYGAEGNVPANFANYFPSYSPTNPFYLLSYGSDVACFTPGGLLSDAGEVIQGDQWMITPPIAIPDAEAMLCFGVAQMGIGGSQKFKIYTSEGGTDKADFTELTSSSMTGSVNSVNLVTRRLLVNGFQGKTVRFAIVAQGNKGGIIGFSNIRAAQYYSNFLNAESLEFVALPQNPTNQAIRVSYQISTPQEVKGFKAVLRTEEGFETTFTCTDKINKSSVREINFVFPEAVDMQGRASQNYSITITPNGEGYRPTILFGRLITANHIYDANAIVEEFTSQTCGWCPRGIAFMDYYKDKYNSLDKGKVIPIMIHDTMDSRRPDPMTAPENYGDPYSQDLYAMTGGQVGFPMALLNRTSVGDPSQIDVDGVMASKSYAKMSIVKAGPDAEDPSQLRIRTANTLSFSTGSFPLRTLAVLIENDVHGTTKSYDQSNYFYQYPMSSVVDAYGSEVAPYFASYVSPNPGTIPAAEMYYPEVARAITNYYGEPMPTTWEAEVASNYDLTLKVPASVMNIENCSVITMILDLNGAVVASDIMPYSEWSDSVESGVEGVADMTPSLTAYRASEGLGIRLSAGSEVEVWSIEGQRLFAGNLQAGEHVLPMAGGRTVIVRALSAGAVQTAKVIL